MKREEWDVVRKTVYAEYHHSCAICGAKGSLECHEMWEYDDIHHTQNLKKMLALCPLCHAVKHFGLAELRASKGELNKESLISHFRKVNDCDKKVFDEHYRKAFQLFEERSKHPWIFMIDGKQVE